MGCHDPRSSHHPPAEIALAFRSLGFVVAEADAIGLLGSRPLRRGQRHRHPSPTEDRHGRTKSGRDHDKDRRRGGHDHGDRTDEEVGGHDAVIAFEEVSDEQLRASLGGQVDYHEALHTLIERARRHLALSGMSQGAEWSAGRCGDRDAGEGCGLASSQCAAQLPARPQLGRGVALHNGFGSGASQLPSADPTASGVRGRNGAAAIAKGHGVGAVPWDRNRDS